MSYNRKTGREIASLIAAEKAINPAFVPSFVLQSDGKSKELRFVGLISIGANQYAIASDSGLVRNFANVDDFVRVVAKVAESGNGDYVLTVKTGQLLASSVPANMATWAAAQALRLNKVKKSQQARVVEIDTQLSVMAGWENGNQAQQAKKTEVQAQRAAVLTDIAAIEAEVTRLGNIH